MQSAKHRKIASPIKASSIKMSWLYLRSKMMKEDIRNMDRAESNKSILPNTTINQE
jgi:hypothetical protein